MDMFGWMGDGYTLAGTTKAGVYVAKRGNRYGVLETRFDGVLRLKDDEFFYSEGDALAVVAAI